MSFSSSSDTSSSKHKERRLNCTVYKLISRTFLITIIPSLYHLIIILMSSRTCFIFILKIVPVMRTPDFEAN